MINPFKVLLARIDTNATAADPDGAGPLVSGYDDVFREPIPNLPGSSVRAVKEQAPILIPCQFEPEDTFEQLREQAAGNDPNTKIRVCFHFSDLEELDLVDAATGRPKLQINDRLVSIHRYDDETLIQLMGVKEGFYCTAAEPRSFGLSGGERNLLLCTYESRDVSLKGGGG